MIDTAQTDSSGNALPVNHCPSCGYKLDSASPVPGQGEHRPSVGDLSVCLKCGEALEFGPGMIVQVASVATLLAAGSAARGVIGKVQRLIKEKRFLT